MNQLLVLLLVVLAIGVQSAKSATLMAINLSGNSFTCGSPWGTFIRTISASPNIGSYAESFPLSAANASGLQIQNGNQLATDETPPGCPTSYAVNVNGSLTMGVNCGLENNCFQPFAVS